MLLSVREAQERLLAAFVDVGVETILLCQGLERILAEDVIAGAPLPAFSNSAMDGFAVRSVDLVGNKAGNPVELSVIGDVPAGISPAFVVGACQAARIMTGAQVPEGADAVIPVEETDFQVRDVGIAPPGKVKINRAVQPGENIRQIGQDVQAGEQVLARGRRLRAVDLGMIAMLGRASISAQKQPLVGVLPTGDELTSPGEALAPGKIYESNSFTLLAAIEAAGARPLHLGVAKDTWDSVASCLDSAVEKQVDLIVTSAGVSVGAFDFVRKVIEDHGRLNFWRVNMRPGKPLVFGEYRGIPLIGLPGNPVSSYVGFEIFVRPAIKKMLGLPWELEVTMWGTLEEPVQSDGRESYLRAVYSRQVNGEITVKLTGHQGSGNHYSLVLANALVVIPAGITSLPVGASVKVIPLE